MQFLLCIFQQLIIWHNKYADFESYAYLQMIYFESNKFDDKHFLTQFWVLISLYLFNIFWVCECVNDCYLFLIIRLIAVLLLAYSELCILIMQRGYASYISYAGRLRHCIIASWITLPITQQSSTICPSLDKILFCMKK